MKYYSNFTTKYVQDICNTLNNAGILMNKRTNEEFAPENFKTLTDFLQSYILYFSDIFMLLNQRGLVNRGKCPYTGQQIDKSFPNWSYMGRTIYLSREGYKIMQREDDEEFEELMGKPAPKRNEISRNKGCSVFIVSFIIIICIALFTQLN